MKVYLQPSGRRILPFDDAIGDTLIQNRPLREWQERALADAGLTRCETLEPPCLVVPDTFFGSGEALRAFVEGAGGDDAVFVLGSSRFGEQTTPVQAGVVPVEGGWRFDALRFVSGRDLEPKLVVVDPQEDTFSVQAPRRYLDCDTLEFGVPKRPLMTLHHWVHILWANQLGGLLEMNRTPRWRLLLRGLGAVLRARSLNRWKVLAKLNGIGRKCDIHPTAVVEGSHLGDGVVVGPFARVMFSELGPGSVVMAGAQVELSVLGEQSVVSEQCVIRFSVLYPGATASQLLMQQCVLGRDALTTKGSVSIDLNFDGPIKVPLDGRLHSTGLRFLGSAYGHRCRVGTGFFLSPGRSVPNGYFLLRDPRTILSVIPPGMEGQALVASGHKARPLALARAVR